ncbi:12098_t:CDS:2, partial [Acaulospora colombiana]
MSQSQYPNKSTSLEIAQDVVMANGEADTRLLTEPSQKARIAPGSSVMKKSSSSSSSKTGSPKKLQDEDLADIKPLVEDPIFRFLLETKAFHYVISGIREHFEKHPGLASKLGIVLANLDPTSNAYKETKSDDALRNALFDAVSKAVNDSRVETWRVTPHTSFKSRSEGTNERFVRTSSISCIIDHQDIPATHKAW